MSLHEKGLINMVPITSEIGTNGFDLHRVEQINDIIHEYIFNSEFGFPDILYKNRIIAYFKYLMPWPQTDIKHGLCQGIAIPLSR